MNRLNGPALLYANAISRPSGRQAGLTLWPSAIRRLSAPRFEIADPEIGSAVAFDGHRQLPQIGGDVDAPSAAGGSGTARAAVHIEPVQPLVDIVRRAGHVDQRSGARKGKARTGERRAGGGEAAQDRAGRAPSVQRGRARTAPLRAARAARTRDGRSASSGRTRRLRQHRVRSPVVRSSTRDSVAGQVDRRVEHVAAVRQDVGPAIADLARSRGGAASTTGSPPLPPETRARPRRVRRQRQSCRRALQLAPAPARAAHSDDRRAAFDAQLLQAAVREEADPLAVGREERIGGAVGYRRRAPARRDRRCEGRGERPAAVVAT